MNSVDLGLQAFVALALISIVFGIGVRAIFRLWSDQAQLRRTKNLMIAHMLELRLFLDEPALVVRAQYAVLIQSVRLIKLLLKPALILTVPMILLFAQLDAVFGRVPLIPGSEGIVTAQMTEGSVAPVMTTPEGVTLETPAVRVLAEREFSWRIRPSRAVSGRLQFVSNDRTVTKTIAAGGGTWYVSQKRTGSLRDFLLHSTELPLPAGNIRSIGVRYPAATIFGLHWMVWFFAISTAAALLR